MLRVIFRRMMRPLRILRPLALMAVCSMASLLQAQLGGDKAPPTHADTLRGSIGPGRAWWDVKHYDVTVEPDFNTRSIKGSTRIAFAVKANGGHMQVDLQEPLVADGITWVDHGVELKYTREGNVLWVDFPGELSAGAHEAITIKYHGIPRAAKNPPWDGGWIWKKDEMGRPWMSVACQGLGASVWYPCKDHQSDEPDSAALHITVPDTLQAVGNGRFKGRVADHKGSATWTWVVSEPINSYNLVPYIGRYVEIRDRYIGESGPLDLIYYVLTYNEAKARVQFEQVRSMMKCFEHWFGPYPFYADGYKLVEAPHLGMEHQSAVAYGNKFMNGYLGQDRSGTGWGLKWDYIIVHESGHEWFGNNITTADIADMWIHEGFTDYSETIYTQCQSGEEAGNDYVIGLRRGIANDRPLIGPYGVNQEGSGDMYNKGANLLHTIRHVFNDDEKFRATLRGLNEHFRHSITTSAEVEAFISKAAGRDLSKVFDQYLRTTLVPRFEYRIKRKHFSYRWAECVPGFDLPVRITIDGAEQRLEPGTEWRTLDAPVGKHPVVDVDRNWYVTTKKVK